MKKLTEEIEKVVDLMMREEEKSFLECLDDEVYKEIYDSPSSKGDDYKFLMKVTKKYDLDNHLFLSLVCLNDFIEGKKIPMKKIEEELTKVVHHMYQNELDHFYDYNEEVFNEFNGQDPWRDEIKYEDFLRVCEKYEADNHILLSLLYFIDNVD